MQTDSSHLIIPTARTVAWSPPRWPAGTADSRTGRPPGAGEVRPGWLVTPLRLHRGFKAPENVGAPWPTNPLQRLFGMDPADVGVFRLWLRAHEGVRIVKDGEGRSRDDASSPVEALRTFPRRPQENGALPDGRIVWGDRSALCRPAVPGG